MAELMDGRDYYIEGGRWVFTAAYHLARGHCCESGCRHCPWRSKTWHADDADETTADENGSSQDLI